MKLTNPILIKAHERGLVVNNGKRVKLQGGRIQFFVKQITVPAALYVVIQESYEKLRPVLSYK